VCTRKGAKVILGRPAQSREFVSVLVCGNVKDAGLPPMIVVKGKTYKALNSWVVQNSPPHGNQRHGWKMSWERTGSKTIS